MSPAARLVLSVLLLASLMGCAGLRSMMVRRDDPFSREAPCRLADQATVDDVVAHVNGNAAKINSWRATSVKIRATNAPPLSGNLVVEDDRRLRLEVTSLAGKEVDFGSNDDVFWMWVKRSAQPGVYYASHSDLEIARQKLPIPFEPEWLMEALGVREIETQGFTLQRVSSDRLELTAERRLPSGQTVKRVVAVHPCHGTVLEHAAYDSQDRLLARAQLREHRIDPQSGAVVPRYVRLDWPEAGLSLAMELGPVEVNLAHLPPAVWQVPQIPHTPLVNLGRNADAMASAAGAATSAAIPASAAHHARSRSGLREPVAVSPASAPHDAGDDPFAADEAFLPPQVRGSVPVTRSDDGEFHPPAQSGLAPPPEFVEPEQPPGRARVMLSPEPADEQP